MELGSESGGGQRMRDMVKSGASIEPEREGALVLCEGQGARPLGVFMNRFRQAELCLYPARWFCCW